MAWLVSDRAVEGRILVVDDEEQVRKVVGTVLRKDGFDVVEAEDGEQALDACRKQLPEAVLLDWNMPVADGAAFLREWRRVGDTDTPPVVVMSGAPDALERALRLGAAAVIAKPFRLDELEAVLLQVLDGPPR